MEWLELILCLFPAHNSAQLLSVNNTVNETQPFTPKHTHTHGTDWLTHTMYRAHM